MDRKKVFLLVLVLLGYGLIPLVNHLFPVVQEYTFLLDLWIINPIIAFVAGVYTTLKGRFEIWFSVVIGVLYLPIMFLFYNDSVLIFVVIYIIAAFIGAMLGKLFSPRNPKTLG